MATEIERKFLVNGTEWQNKFSTVKYYKQGYISDNLCKVVRVRIIDETAFLTIKGQRIGISAPEFEYEIPLKDAQEMFALGLCSNNFIEKYRYTIKVGDLIWEIDEFLGDNKGLVIAEVELESINQSIILPSWINKEVSLDHRYTNVMLSINPYNKWENINEN